MKIGGTSQSVRKGPAAVRAIRKAARVVDPLVSELELRASGLALRSRASHQERLVLLAAARVLQKPGAVVYDIGAATGAYATAFAKVETVSHVIAFEPLAESFAELERRAQAEPKIRCLQLALADESAELGLKRSAWQDTSSFLPVGPVMRREFPRAAQIEAEEVVRVARLDDVVSEYSLPLPDLVKLDVQGFEDRVIRGASATLRSTRMCVVEMSFRPLYEGSPLFDDVYPLMRALDFRLAGFHGSLVSADRELLQADAVFERS